MEMVPMLTQRDVSEYSDKPMVGQPRSTDHSTAMVMALFGLLFHFFFSEKPLLFVCVSQNNLHNIDHKSWFRLTNCLMNLFSLPSFLLHAVDFIEVFYNDTW